MTTMLDLAQRGRSDATTGAVFGGDTSSTSVRFGTVTAGGSYDVTVQLDGSASGTEVSYELTQGGELVPTSNQAGTNTVVADVETTVETGTRVAVVLQGNNYKVISIGTLPDIVEDVEEMQLLVRYVENVDDYTGVGTWTGTLVGKIPASGSGTYSGMGALTNANGSFDIVYFDYSYSTGEVTEMGYRNSSFGPHRARLGLDMTSYGMVELFGNTFQLAGGSLDGSGISWWNQLASSHGPIYLFPPDNSSVIIGTDDPDMGRMADGDESMANWDSVGHDVTLTVHGPIYADSGIYLNAASSSTQVDVGTALTASMHHKGTIGTGGTVTALPSSATVGDVYMVKTAGTWAGKTCEAGDMLICNTTYTTVSNDYWDVVQANLTTLTDAEIIAAVAAA